MREHLFTNKNSHIFKHLKTSPSCQNACSESCFMVLDSASNYHNIKLKEARHITWEWPKLNKQLQHYNTIKFDSRIDKICNKAAMHLNAIKRLARFMGSKEREVIMNSFILCHFNYCPLIWSFCSNASQKKLKKINERALRPALSDYTSSYNTLLVNAKSTTMHIPSVRLLALEILKTFQNLNPAFMKGYFTPKSISYNFRQNDVFCVPKVKTTTYDIKSLRFLGSKCMELSPK